MGCRLEKSKQWAIRCVHEASLHRQNSFITLTYNDESLPEYGTLKKEHLQAFFKRLRHHKGKFRYYACGEYGDHTERAHYHACIFGLDFHDKVPFRKIGDHQLYTSKNLTDIWGHGHTSIGNLTFETAAYTARYVTKKLSHGQAKYNRLDKDTGEIIPLEQPRAFMSLKPAIGRNWIEKYHQDIYGADKDTIRIRGKAVRPAKYYDKIYDTINPEHLAVIKSNRINNAEGLTTKELNARELKTRAKQFTKKQI